MFLFLFVSGCYAKPAVEVIPSSFLSIPVTLKTDPILFCKLKCKSQNLDYFFIELNITCQCLRSNVPLGGTHFDAFWRISMHFNTFGPILMHFDAFRRILTHFDAFRRISTHFDAFQCILTHFDAFWRILTHFQTFLNFCSVFYFIFN